MTNFKQIGTPFGVELKQQYVEHDFTCQSCGTNWKNPRTGRSTKDASIHLQCPQCKHWQDISWPESTQYDPVDEGVVAILMGKPPKTIPWLPADLLEYLETLLHPPGGGDLLIVDLVHDPLPDGPPDHYHGAIVRGTPTPEESGWILGMLRPGAHMFLVAPDTEPTGHTGACNIEDAGFEIRDAIAWVRQAGHVHYCPKVKSKKERHAGTGGLNNEHVTVKPVKLMERLLQEIPKDKLVGDYFLGSGSTGIAALKTGHDFIGIELEEASLKTAEKRIRHWDAQEAGWNRAEVISDVQEPEPVAKPMTLDELFRGGE